MSLRCLVIVFGLFAAAQAASIKSKNIPVEVVYERTNPPYYGTRNLDAKPQLTPDIFLKLKLSDDIINEGKGGVVEAQLDEIPNETHGNPYGVRNLDAKIQLSPEELGQALKFLPNTVEIEEELKSELENEEKPEEPEEPEPQNPSLVSLLKKAEEIAYSGINSIRNNIDKASEAIANGKPTNENWEKLNQTLEKFFRDQYKSINLKQDKPPENSNENNQGNQVWQQIVTNFQTTVGNWANNIFQQNNSPKPEGSEDEQQNQGAQQNQGLWQQFFNGFSQVVNNMVNLNPSNSNNNGTAGQEDTGTGTGSGGGNVFTNFVNSIQQVFGGQGNQGSNPAQGTNNQSDTGVQPPANPGGFVQQAFNQFVNSFRPTSTTKAPVQGDEGTATSTTTQSPGLFGNFGQAFQNIIGSSQPPQGGSGGSNPISSGAAAIGSQIGGVFGGQGGSGNGGGGGSNPITSGAQAIGSIGSQLTGGQVGGEGGTQGGSNPLTSGAQAVGGQLGQLVGGGNNPLQNFPNPLGGGSTTAAAASTEKAKVAAEEAGDAKPLPATSPQENVNEEKNETIEKLAK